MSVFFYLVGVVSILICFVVIGGAPSAVQEIAGFIIGATGLVSLGIGALLDRIDGATKVIAQALDRVETASRSSEAPPTRRHVERSLSTNRLVCTVCRFDNPANSVACSKCGNRLPAT